MMQFLCGYKSQWPPSNVLPVIRHSNSFCTWISHPVWFKDHSHSMMSSCIPAVKCFNNWCMCVHILWVVNKTDVNEYLWRTLLSLCRGLIVINATLSFELHPEEEKGDREEERSGEIEEGGMHVIYLTNTQTSEPGGCGVSHTSIPPIQIIPQTHRVS